MKRLFIAEKPSLGRAIAAGLGKGKSAEGYITCGDDIVTWCFGHILEQAMPEEYDVKYKSWRINDLPIIPSVWKLNISKSASKQFAIIKNENVDSFYKKLENAVEKLIETYNLSK